MPVLPSCSNQSIDANQLTGFYMRATLPFNWLIKPQTLEFGKYVREFSSKQDLYSADHSGNIS